MHYMSLIQEYFYSNDINFSFYTGKMPTIYEFKQKIYEKLYIPIHKKKLIFVGEEIADDKQIINKIKFHIFNFSYYGISKHSDFVDIKVIDCRKYVICDYKKF